MPLSIDFDATRECLVLQGKLTIHHASEAMNQFRKRPGKHLDLSGIIDIDGAGLQLLLAANRDAGMQLLAVSDDVADVIRLSGRHDLLETRAC